MKKLILPSLLFSCLAAVGQINTTKLDKRNLPQQIISKGIITNAVTWKDSLGVNYVLTTEPDEYISKDAEGNEFENAELFAYHYVRNGDSVKLLWRVYDYSKDCEFDLSAEFIDEAFSVTDLDKNGIAEVWVMYEIQCTSDVSPPPAKIIMYEGNKKYAVRGSRRIRVSGQDYGGGEYTLDDNMKSGNPVFRKYAINLWEKYKIKKI